MTKEITKSIILQAIQDKLKLRELIPEKFTFSENVVPTYNIEQHLLNFVVASQQESVTSIGGVSFYIVPQTERWHVNGYNVIFMSGAYTVAGVYILRAPQAAFLYLDLKAAQNASYAVNLDKELILDAGDSLNINVDGYTSTGNLRLYLDYAVEEIR